MNTKPLFSYDPRTAYSSYVSKSVKYGDVDITSIKNIVEDKAFVVEMSELILSNHEVVNIGLSSKLWHKINAIFKGNEDLYLRPFDEASANGDLQLTLFRLMNLGYTIGYYNQKFKHTNIQFTDIFGYDGEVFGDDFKQISYKALHYKGNDISHYSLLAGIFTIAASLEEENLVYDIEEQGRTEIQVVFPKAYIYGMDCGAKVVDLEKKLSDERGEKNYNF